MIEHHILSHGALCSVEGAPEALDGVLWIDLCNPTRWEERLIEDKGAAQEQDLKKLVQQVGRKNRALSILRDATSGKAAKTAEEAAPPVARLSPKGVARLKAIERDLRSLSAYEAQTEQELTFLHSAIIGLIGVEQNQIIKVLSVATALFLPPTLVGTIYGMNFDHMPELDWRYGYPLALGAMVVSALLPYLWFRRRKWL